jgi:flagellar hook assembly protein FlgD
LNDFYVSDLDTYQSGKLEYNFSRLAPGNHTLDFKVWDVNNNSSSVRIEFTVAEKQELALDHVLNYPNPFTTRTTFFFEHNQVCESLETQIQIFTISGKLVRTINQLVRTNGFRTEGVDWDGRDEYGDQLAKGVYIYRLSVKSPEGDLADKTEKLVLLK